MTQKSENGFTLIELMITVAIVGVLASIAYPSYMASVLKGRRAEGRTAILQLLQQQERYMTQNNCYLGFTTNGSGVASASAPSPITACGGVTSTTVPFKVFSGDSVANSGYLLSAGTCPGTTSLSIAECVRVTATPVKADADAGSLQMTSTGIRSCTGSKSSVCW